MHSAVDGCLKVGKAPPQTDARPATHQDDNWLQAIQRLLEALSSKFSSFHQHKKTNNLEKKKKSVRVCTVCGLKQSVQRRMREDRAQMFNIHNATQSKLSSALSMSTTGTVSHLPTAQFVSWTTSGTLRAAHQCFGRHQLPWRPTCRPHPAGHVCRVYGLATHC